MVYGVYYSGFDEGLVSLVERLLYCFELVFYMLYLELVIIMLLRLVKLLLLEGWCWLFYLLLGWLINVGEGFWVVYFNDLVV